MYMNLITPVLFLQKKQTNYVLLPVLTEKFPVFEKVAAIGPAYWDNQFSARFCELMQKEYDDPGSKDLSWEAFYSNHLDELSLTLRKYPEGIVREFNSLDELCLFDTSYIPYRDSLKAT